MPKKKQVSFQNSIPGKFIPRNDPPSGSVFPSGANNNRFNAKMAELLASSSTINNENELVSTKSPEDNSTTTTNSEIQSIDSSRVPSKLLHRRIVTMLETLTKPNEDSSTSPLTSSHTQHKSQPITFGQLRQATISSSSATIIEDKPTPQPITIDTEEKHPKTLTSFVRDSCPDLTSITSKPSGKHQTNKERLYYSPSLEQLFEQQNVVSQTKKEEEQSQKSSLTVDEILAMYYSKINQSTNTESHLPSSTYPNTTGFYIHPSGPRWNSLQSNQHNIPPPPRLVLNEQNRNRPPPPSYTSSIASGHRMTSTVPNPAQHFIRPSVSSSILEHLYPGASTSQHLLTENSSIIHPNSSSTFVPTMINPINNNNNNNNSVRPPPPRYKSPTSNVDRSHSTLSSINDFLTSSQQSKTIIPTTNNSSTGFDREFSRLLYGKDAGKARRQKQKQRRKAFSDPVKKSVEEAGRSFEKAHRRVTTHLNKTDSVKVDADDEAENESPNYRRQELNFLSRRRFQRQSDLIEKNRESAKKAIVPANPILKRRIPSFLRVYSRASPSSDILLQWHLFTLPELESFYAMMTRLYKNENLARVQLYEIYRTALLSALASKTSSNTDDDESDAMTTPL